LSLKKLARCPLSTTKPEYILAQNRISKNIYDMHIILHYTYVFLSFGLILDNRLLDEYLLNPLVISVMLSQEFPELGANAFRHVFLFIEDVLPLLGIRSQVI